MSDETINVSLNPQVAFRDFSLEWMMIPSGKKAVNPKDKPPVERWDLDRPLTIAKGDEYALLGVRATERALASVLTKNCEPYMKGGEPVVMPVGDALTIEFQFYIRRFGHGKGRDHWRYGVRT
jgi:hypothetical protein